MTETFTRWPAPAKLNMFLHITGRRPDGYHELQTLYQLLDWGDEVRIRLTPGPGIRRINKVDGVSEQHDLAIRAAKLLQAASACRKGADIELIKNIPMGSGLGGGSSDAATVLRVLNHLWGCGLSVDELAGLGFELGADVPVFVHGQSSWAEGLGEKLQACKTDDCWYVLVFPGVAISTAEIFQSPELKRDSAPISLSEYDYSRTCNAFEKVVMKRHPELRQTVQELSKWGLPRLTGSGSCIFLPINEKNDAKDITNHLKSRYNVLAARGVNRSPLLAKLPEVN